MDDLLRAALLGVVQGLTEFLPISSSGHLILIRSLFGWEDEGLAFDVGLHLGTLLALLVYFWRDWFVMIRAALRELPRSKLRFAEYEQPAQLIWLIALGSIPAAVAGLLFDDWIEDHVRQPWLVAITLAVVGTIMLVADRRTRQARTVAGIGLADAVIIGFAQAAALIPGVSRSGATMSAALFRDFTRDSAARFAFLLGTPAFVGAALLKAADLRSEASDQLEMMVVGFVASAVVGFAVIHYLLRFLRTQTLVPFVVYRYAVAVLTLLIAVVRVA